MKRYYINRSPIEEALGYGSLPSHSEIEETLDLNKTQTVSPIQN
jgi:hypothetical protein